MLGTAMSRLHRTLRSGLARPPNWRATAAAPLPTPCRAASTRARDWGSPGTRDGGSPGTRPPGGRWGEKAARPARPIRTREGAHRGDRLLVSRTGIRSSVPRGASAGEDAGGEQAAPSGRKKQSRATCGANARSDGKSRPEPSGLAAGSSRWLDCQNDQRDATRLAHMGRLHSQPIPRSNSGNSNGRSQDVNAWLSTRVDKLDTVLGLMPGKSLSPPCREKLAPALGAC